MNSILYYCLKLKSGETIFAEVVSFDTNHITITNPMLITTEIHGQNESMSMIPWIPYTESSNITLLRDHVYFCDDLNKQFFEYYGRIVIQLEMNKIKQRVAERMESRSDIRAISDGLDEMKEVSGKLSEKFGVDGPDFSDFEEILNKHKNEVVLH